jgi:hypothetical protein
MSKLSAAVKSAFEPAMFDDIDVDVTSALFVSHHFEPNDLNPDGSDVIQAEVAYKSADDKEFTQQYRVGSPEYVEITNDGSSINFKEGSKGLSKKSEFYHFYTELANAGYPVAELDEDAKGFTKGLVGGNYHIKAEPVLDDEGKPKTHVSKKNNREYKTTRLIITKVNKLPWEKKGAKSTSASSKATTTKAAEKAAPADDDFADEIRNFIIGQVAGDPMSKAKLIPALVKEYAKDAEKRKAAVNLVNDPKFLESIEGVSFDGKTLSLAE